MKNVNILLKLTAVTCILFFILLFSPGDALSGNFVNVPGVPDDNNFIKNENYCLPGHANIAADKNVDHNQEKEDNTNNEDDIADIITPGYVFLVVIWISILYALFIMTRMRSKKKND